MNKEQEELIINNQGLVHHIVNQFNPQNQMEHDDYASEGMYGLIKAARTYDKSKKAKFSTYASMCIKNEILMYLRKNKKNKFTCSLDMALSEDENGNTLTVGAIIGDTSSFDEYDNNEFFINATNIVLNYLKNKERTVILYRMGDFTQRTIAKMLGISQSYISRIEKKARRKMKECYDENLQVDNKFSINMTEDYYILSFSHKKIRDISKLVKSLLKYLALIENLPFANIKKNRECVEICLSRDSIAFIAIANIIEEIEKYTEVKEKVDKTKETLTELKSEKNNEETVIKSTSKEKGKNTDTKVKNKSKNKKIAIPKKVSNAEYIRRYMLTKDSFEVKDICRHFLGTYNYSIVRWVIKDANERGLIRRISYGKYVVNKN